MFHWFFSIIIHYKQKQYCDYSQYIMLSNVRSYHSDLVESCQTGYKQLKLTSKKKCYLPSYFLLKNWHDGKCGMMEKEKKK